MKKIFLDCGANKLHGLSYFCDVLNLDNTWIVHSFEMNPNLTEQWSNLTTEQLSEQGWIVQKDWPFSFHFHPYGLSTIEEIVYFVQENTPEAGNQGSRLKKYWFDGHSTDAGGEILKAKVIRFSDFIKQNCNPEDFIVMKMDIEGSEFDVIEDLISENLHTYFNEIYIEWHERFFPDKKTINQRASSIKYFLEKDGVVIHDWV